MILDEPWRGVGINNWGIKINPPYEYAERAGRNRNRGDDFKDGIVETVYLLVGAVAASLFSNGFGGGVEEILRFLAVLVSAAVLREGWTLLLLLIDRPLGFAFLPCLTGTLLPEFFGTLLFAIPVFFIFRGRD